MCSRLIKLYQVSLATQKMLNQISPSTETPSNYTNDSSIELRFKNLQRSGEHINSQLNEPTEITLQLWEMEISHVYTKNNQSLQKYLLCLREGMMVPTLEFQPFSPHHSVDGGCGHIL